MSKVAIAQIKPLKDRHYIVFFLILALLLYALVFMLKFEGLRSPDQMDYAQIARHLYNGDGFITSSINPLSLTFYDSIKNHPNLWRAPLYPLLVSASFHIFGINDAAVTLVSGFFYILLIPLVYLFAKEMFGRKVGLLAGMISLTSVVLVNYGMTGLTETMFTFLFTLSLFLLYKRVNPLFIGFLLGLCYLTRYNLLFIIPGILWFIYKEYPNWKIDVLKLVAVFMITISPWWIRNFSLVGNPLFSLQKYEIAMFNDVFKSYSLYRTFQPIEPTNFIISHPISMIKKAIYGAGVLFVGIPRVIFNFFVSAIGIAGLFDIRREGKNFNFFVSLLIMIFLQALALAIIHPLPRLFVPFVPVIIILASYKVVNIIDASRDVNIRRALIGIFVVLILFANIAGIFINDYSHSSYVHEEEIEYIKSIVGENEAMVTDVPWMVAWYCERTGIWFPVTYESMKMHLPSVNYVYFSAREQTGSFREQNIEKEYIDNPIFREDFKLIKEFNSGAVLFKKSK